MLQPPRGNSMVHESNVCRLLGPYLANGAGFSAKATCIGIYKTKHKSLLERFYQLGKFSYFNGILKCRVSCDDMAENPVRKTKLQHHEV